MVAFSFLFASPRFADGQCFQPASLIFNGGFENHTNGANCNPTPPLLFDGAFNLGCVENWQSAIGTPSICFDGPNNGEAYACIGGNPEGIFQTVDLCEGEEYELAFYLRSFGPQAVSRVSVYLANGLTNHPFSNPSTPLDIDPSWQLLESIEIEGDEWHLATITVAPVSAQNNQLLFIIDPEGDPETFGAFGLDDVQLACETSFPVGFTSTSLGNGNINFVANLPAGADACWDFGDGSSGFGNNVAHTYAMPGSYTVCVTAACGCYAEFCQSVVVPDLLVCPCTEANTLNIEANENGTLYSVLEEFYNFDQNDDGVIDETEHNNCIAIAGRLIIDQDVAIVGCDNIRMQPCAEVMVRGFQHLAMEFNTIYGCETMWRNIQVEPHGRLTFRRNTVSDAQHTLWVEPVTVLGLVVPTQVDIQHNRFERNHIGLYIPGNGGGFFGGVVWQTPFIGNNILCKGLDNTLGDLLPSCDAALDNYDSEHGYIGVATLGANFRVGEPGGAFNTFSNLRNGVIGEQVFLDVDRSNFNNMIGFMNNSVPSFTFSEGMGVLVNGGQNNVRDANFNGAGHAVYSSLNQLNMLRNTATKVHYGLETRNPVRLNMAENRDIHFFDFGVRVRDLIGVQGFSSHVIDSNVFRTQNVQTTSDGDWAMELLNTNTVTVPDGSGRISRNEMYINDQVGGLAIYNLSAWSITDNRAEFSAHPNSEVLTGAGISLRNSNYNGLHGNTILDATGIAYNATTGLATLASVGNRFCCNSTEGNFVGSLFLGTCLGTNYRQTDMASHGYSLWLPGAPSTGFTMIGQQPIQIVGNTTNNNRFGAASGTAQNDAPGTILNDSRFYVTNQNTPNYPQFVYTPNGTSNQWFQINNATTFGCIDDNQCPDPQYPPSGRGELEPTDIEIAKNTYGNISGGAAMQWEGERDLYARLKAYPAMLSQSADVDTFFNNVQSGSAIKDFYIAEAVTATVQEVPLAWGQALQTATDTMEAVEAEATAKLAGLASVSTRADSLEVYWQAAAIRDRLIAPMAVVLEKQHQIDSLRRVRAATALTTVTSLPANNVLQSNRKNALLVYLEITSAGATQLTQSQFDTISAIARQCPLAGGSAVYMARALYQLNEQKHFDDFDLCGVVAERSAPAMSSKPRADKVLLWPNPTDGHLQLYLPGIDAEQQVQVQVQVADLSGREVLERSIGTADGNLALDASKLSPGIYFCRVSTNSQVFATVKFVITH